MNRSRRRFLEGALAFGASAALPPFAFAQSASSTATRMAEGRPSATAMGAAMLRAVHQLVDSPWILDDPLALPVIGRESEARLVQNVERYSVRRALRASVALRSRYAEDMLGEAVERGVRQYVLLGAGLDTFAYRNPFARAGLRVFEVDHPATQGWKRRRLAETGIRCRNRSRSRRSISRRRPFRPGSRAPDSARTSRRSSRCWGW